MSEIRVRSAEGSFEEAYWDIRAHVYSSGEPVPVERRTRPYSNDFVAIDEGGPFGIFSLMPLSATRGDAVVPCAGVAGVGVLPNRRRIGLGHEMMRDCCRAARNRGFPLASLYAYREPFYRNLGFEVCGKRLKLTVPLGRMPSPRSDLEIRRLRPDDWQWIEQCYRDFGSRHSGIVVRSEALWKRKLAEHSPLVIYAAGDPIEAYCALNLDPSYWVDLWVSEVVWCTARGYQSVLTVMSGLAMNKNSISWHEPSDGPFYSQFLDHSILCSLDRPIMFRVLDVPTALAQLKPQGKGEVLLEVDDDLIPENRGPWRIAWADSSVEVKSAQRADLCLTAQQLAQVFLGEPSFEDLLNQRCAQVESEAQANHWKTLFPASTVFCNDFF